MTDLGINNNHDSNNDQSSTIGPDDVLLGRGGATNNHDGNRRFRILVAENQREYLKARKRDKVIIARRIVSIVQSKGGRFLKRGTEDNSWVPVPDKRAQEKTSQALREGLDVRNNTIRPNKIIKALRRNSESSTSHTGSQNSTAAYDKPPTVITGKVVTPNPQTSTKVFLANVGQPLQNTANRAVMMPGLTSEPSEPFFLLYQPPPLNHQVIDRKCEV
jgi:hypothetical protein